MATTRARKPAAAKTLPEEDSTPSSRAIWKGSINFGLVNIPVSLHTAEDRDDLSFKLLDSRTLSPVRYQRVNEKTGKEVPWDQIAKGFEYEEGQFVVVTEEDLREANVEATQTVEITDFVDAAKISPIYYDKPYYLEPLKKGRKSYALLREVLQRTGKVGIAKIVIRTRQYLAAVVAEGPLLFVNLLRFQDELRKIESLDLPAKSEELSEKEIKMAERLVEAMVGEWDPSKYRDDYQQDLLKLIEKKVESGQTESIETPAEKVPPKRSAKVVDIMDLLKRSVEKVEKDAPQQKRKPEARRKAS